MAPPERANFPFSILPRIFWSRMAVDKRPELTTPYPVRPRGCGKSDWGLSRIKVKKALRSGVEPFEYRDRL